MCKKCSNQLLDELDQMIESDFQKAKKQLEEFKNRPSVFEIFTLNENIISNYVNTNQLDIFEDNIINFSDETPTNNRIHA